MARYPDLIIIATTTRCSLAARADYYSTTTPALTFDARSPTPSPTRQKSRGAWLASSRFRGQKDPE